MTDPLSRPGLILLIAGVLFFGLAIIEYIWLTRVKRQSYPWKQAGASLVLLLGRRLSRLAAAPLIGVVYVAVYQERLMTLRLDAAWKWVLRFCAVEFFYYWFHRLSHEVRWLWANHNVHHSAEQLNIPASGRLGWTGLIAGGWLIWLPLVWLGVHPLAVVLMISLNLIYQTWPHTEAVPKLGPLEWVLNTPSHHRVHHALNPRYLDRNYGGVVIVYDRLFGSFAEEDLAEPCRYGLVKPNPGANPFVIALREWVDIARDLWTAQSWRARLMYAFGPLGWSEDGSRTTTAMIRAGEARE